MRAGNFPGMAIAGTDLSAPAKGHLALLDLFSMGAMGRIFGLMGLFQGPETRAQFQTSGQTAGFKRGIFSEGPFGNVGFSDITRGLGSSTLKGISDFLASFDRELARTLTHEQTGLVATALQSGSGRVAKQRKFNEANIRALVRDRIETIFTELIPDADCLHDRCTHDLSALTAAVNSSPRWR